MVYPANKAVQTVTLADDQLLRIKSADGKIELEVSKQGHIQVRSYIAPLLNWHGEPCELVEEAPDA